MKFTVKFYLGEYESDFELYAVPRVGEQVWIEPGYEQTVETVLHDLNSGEVFVHLGDHEFVDMDKYGWR